MSSVKIEKDGPNCERLLAEVVPGAFNLREKGKVRRRATRRERRGQLPNEPGRVLLDFQLQPSIQPRAHFVYAHIFRRAVQLLPTGLEGLFAVNRPHSFSQLGPCILFEIGRELWLAFKAFDGELLRPASFLPRDAPWPEGGGQEMSKSGESGG